MKPPTCMMHQRLMLQPFRGNKILYHPSHLPQRGLLSPLSQKLFTKSPLISRYASISNSSVEQLQSGAGDRSLLTFSKEAEEDSWSFAVIPGFVSPEEEDSLMKDVTRSLRGKKYQFDHWDGAIKGYRETEKSHWSGVNQSIIDRLKTTATAVVEGKSLTPLEAVHVLDLAKDGYIKPHTDSIKFCGDVIAGISLLSPSIMKLQHKSENRWITALLPRLSLYVMKSTVRYDYTHAIPAGDESEFKGQPILRDRRVSIICRTVPNDNYSNA